MKVIIKYWKILKETAIEFFYDDPMSYSASIAFYTIFSMPAIFIISTTIAGGLYKNQAARENILHQVKTLIGPAQAATVQQIMQNAGGLGSSLAAKIFGIGMLVFSATTVFGAIENALNNVWNIKPTPKSNLLEFIRDRLMSLSMVACMGFVLLVSLFANAFILNFNNQHMGVFSGTTHFLISAGNLLVLLLVVAIIFVLLFKIIPDAQIGWEDVWVGAIVSTLLFAFGKYLINLYVQHSTFTNTYGAAGSLVIILLWVYYSSLIVLFGAEFTYVHSRVAGHSIRPDKNAAVINEKELQNGFIHEQTRQDD